MCWNEAPISDDSQFEGWWDHWSQVVRIGVNGFTIPFTVVNVKKNGNALTRPEPVQNLQFGHHQLRGPYTRYQPIRRGLRETYSREY